MPKLVYAGIDEAGYGPMLGPLCVAASAFVLDDCEPGDGAPNLWKVLSRAVCRRKSDARRRIAVDDSKKLKGANAALRTHPLRHLERAVLAFSLAPHDTTELPWPDDAALYEHLGVRFDEQPWYASRTPVPVAHTAGELSIAARRLQGAMTAAGARCELLRCEVVDAESLNHGVDRAGSKAVVNFGAAMRLAAAVWDRWSGDHPRIIVDRQGGRTHYREDLQLSFPDAAIRVVAESEAVSRYRLVRGGSPMTISFVRESEDRHLPVALASMTAKYVRELLMIRFNRFFGERLPELKPTAGYFQDARRYLREIEPVLRDLDLPRRALIRQV